MKKRGPKRKRRNQKTKKPWKTLTLMTSNQE